MIETTSLPLPGLLLFEPRSFSDERGFFLEIWRASAYAAAGLPDFVQDNTASSRRGVLRGLHFQNPDAQGKLITVVHGAIFDVAVDLRLDSPGFGQWAHCELQQLQPPSALHSARLRARVPGALGRCRRHVQVTSYYNPAAELTLLYNDPNVNVQWPLANPIGSAKDRAGTTLWIFPATGSSIRSTPAAQAPPPLLFTVAPRLSSLRVHTGLNSKRIPHAHCHEPHRIRRRRRPRNHDDSRIRLRSAPDSGETAHGYWSHRQ